ncbi:hypothetical protein LRX76_03090 [Stenotrophomonas sp. MMGLT7]|nr:hypothetical protein [Stenotrophomonas sp. MMGLT7]
MKRMAKAGSALFLLSLLAVAGAAWAFPSIPCTAENEGQEVRDGNAIYQCFDGIWLRVAVCTDRGCIYI